MEMLYDMYPIGDLVQKCGLQNTVYAAETQIQLDENAQQFSTIESDLDFQDMEPGEIRNGNIHIQNTSKNAVTFYLSAELLENIAAQPDTTQNAVYKILLYRQNEEKPFYEKQIDKQGDFAPNIELATLKKNEEVSVQIQLQFDGKTMDNSYQERHGKIRFYVRAVKKERPSTSIVTVLTGDSKDIFLWICLCVATIAGFIYLCRTLFKR